MFSRHRRGEPLRVLVLIFGFVLASAPAALAQAGTSVISGTVTAANQPVAGASVTAAGSNLTLRAQTDARGAFTIAAVPAGSYDVEVTAPQGRASLRVDVTGAAGAHLTIALSQLKEIGRTSVTARPPVRGSGTDLSLNAEALAHSPAAGSLPNLLIQLPGAARGANGVVHINGDHGDINYIVDGVQIPQELNRIVGSEFDPNDIAFVEALQGAYPAQYGERFASVININTRNGAGPPGFIGDVDAGSYAGLDTTLGYHTTIGKGSLVVALRNQRGNRGLDPPNFDSPHHAFSNANQFLRYTQPAGPHFLNLTFSRSYQTYQIPNDVANGQPATTDDNETQEDLFTALQFRHPIGDHGSLSFGPSYKRSRIRDFGDANNDFTFGEAGNPGAPSDCANALAASGPVVDDAPNVGHLSAFYEQDAWKMGPLWQLDYGVRGDSFAVGSTQFSTGFGQLSPRIKLTRFFGARDSVYSYYARFFTPFSLENVAPLAAYTRNLPLRTNVAQFDLKPQRDSVYEIGGHFALGRGDLGVRIMQKNATDLIDDTQVGVTNLHQDINFAQGRIATQTAYYQVGLARAGRFYAAVTHTYAVNKGCETQLLAPCFSTGDDWSPADHDQRVDVTSGLVLNERHGGWFSVDAEYGSGLSSALNPTGGISCGGIDGSSGGPCKRTPHLTFDAEKGLALHGGMALTLRVRNLLNDRYYVTFANAQGNHYAPPRTFDVGLRLNTK